VLFWRLTNQANRRRADGASAAGEASGLSGMLGTMHGPTKIDDPLRFLEPKRPMRCMSH